MTSDRKSVPSVSVSYACTGSSAKANIMGMRPMQERAFEKRGEQYLLIKSPPASGKSRALMFVALDKLANQGLSQAIIVVPEKSIGASFNDEPLSRYGFSADWRVAPRWNLCNAPGEDGGKVKSVGAFLDSDDQMLVCTHATFRFAVDKFGVEAFDNRLIAVDEFHHVSSSPDNKLGLHLGDFIARDKVHLVAMIHADDTPVPVLDPGRGKTATGRLWAYAVDDRASGATTPPLVWYEFTTDRTGAHPQRQLASFAGFLQADAYAGYDRLYATNRVTEVACWAHFRRKIFDIHATKPTPLTTDLLARIGQLYAIEAEVRGHQPDKRQNHPTFSMALIWL